jgi:hypothetical protein
LLVALAPEITEDAELADIVRNAVYVSFGLEPWPRYW